VEIVGGRQSITLQDPNCVNVSNNIFFSIQLIEMKSFEIFVGQNLD
jgi:hypothetical protein